ncbi:MAG: IS110 family transposase [Alphaproteobacteria bacterium]
MSRKATDRVTTIGIDIGKNTFHLVGLDAAGSIVLRRKLSRGQVLARFANLPPCLIGMEACVGAHHLSRQLLALGHDARLMPARYVRPFLKGQKNDFRDAEAIAEAVQRPRMRFVPTKSVEQLDLQALHRVRSRLVRHRTAVINQIRALLLERGIAVRQGHRFLSAALPDILGRHSDLLSPRMIRMIAELRGDWHHLDERIERVTEEIETLAKADEACQRMITVPGIGPIIASAMVAAVGDGAAFGKGRDFAAWLGLVPRQISTGDRTILGRISKRGNTYLRTLFVRGARVILLRPANWPKHSFGTWLAAASKRMHRNVLAVALANKLARIAWSVLAGERRYEARAKAA